MLSRKQLITVWEYCKYFKLWSEKLARDAKTAPNLSPELRGAIVNEQHRRAKELKRLEKALWAEIEAHEGSIEGWPERAASQNCNDTRTKTTIQRANTPQKRLKERANGKTDNANANGTKRKRGRPRKAEQITTENGEQ